MFYGCYLVGSWITGEHIQHFDFSLSGEALQHSLEVIWEPLLLGCLVCATLASIMGYFSIQWLWRWHVIKQRKKRLARARARAIRAARNVSQRTSTTAQS
jgi:hypothetical protein